MDYTMLDFDGLKAELDALAAEYTAISAEVIRRAKEELNMLKERASELSRFIGDLESDDDPNPAKSPKASKAKKDKAAPKYRHPHDETMTWSGNGKRPKWFKDWIDAGNDPTRLLIAA